MGATHLILKIRERIPYGTINFY